MTRLLDRYFDAALVIDKSVTMEHLVEAQVARLQSALAVARVAAAFPRRLGGDATAPELALDKKRSRRIAHALSQSLKSWGGEEREANDDELREGAQVDWLLWQEQREVELNYLLRYSASWAKTTENLRYGKSAVTRLSQELEWLRYACRDV